MNIVEGLDYLSIPKEIIVSVVKNYNGVVSAVDMRLQYVPLH